MSRVIYVTPSITLLINVYVNAGIELSLDTTLPIREDRNFRNIGFETVKTIR